jgi:hypothetical protein
MHKVYLLLRNNHQSEPLTLDELLQHELKSTDLVWEEGKSGGWSYPYEIESLKPFIKLSGFEKERTGPAQKADPASGLGRSNEVLPFDMDAPFASPNVASKNVYVSLPGHTIHREEPKNEICEESLEQKAEAIRRRALDAINNKTATPSVKPLEPDYELETKLSRTTSELGEDYSAWLYTQKIGKKKKARKRRSILVSMSAVLVIAVGVVYILLSNRGSYTDGNTAIEHTTPENQGIRQAGMVTDAVEQPLMSEPGELEKAADSMQGDDETTSLTTNTIKKTANSTAKKITGAPTTDTSKPFDATVGNEVKPTEQVPDTQIAEEASNNPGVAAAPKQKETLGKKIGNFFGKFKNKEKRDRKSNEQPEKESTIEQPKTESTTGERVAKKRTDEVAPVTNLANKVSITANTSSGNWMMGVQNLKLTLLNKSDEILKTAIVEVRYYNEDKELLEKKVVEFSNVSPKKSQTIAAPNHRLADHADYQLISAVAKEDSIVKQ